jgi:small subunit ribosomal protein S16
MAVKIRLSRVGKKHVPFYHVVAVDSKKKRDGACLANIGTYDGLKGQVITFNEELYNDWISKGAQPTDSALKVLRKHKQPVS